MNSPHFKTHKLLYIFLLISIFSFIILWVLTERYPTHTTFIGIVSAIGQSFFLAGLLTLTVEKMNGQNSKEVYQKEISKLSLAFLTLFGKSNKEELYIKDKEFTNTLINIAGQSYYREDYQLTIENIDKDGFINLWIQHTTQNLLDMNVDKEYRFAYDTKIEDVNFKCLKITDYDDTIIFNGDTKKKIKSISSSKNHHTLIKYPYILSAKKFIKFQIGLGFKLKKTDDKIMPFNSTRITKDLIIKVKDTIEKDYNVSFSEFHNLKEEKRKEDAGYYIYKFKGYLLPYQGFELRFHKNKQTIRKENKALKSLKEGKKVKKD